jgi:hypothetical protein
MKIVKNKCRNRKSAPPIRRWSTDQKGSWFFFSLGRGRGSGAWGFCFLFFMFPMCSLQVPIMSLKFPMCFIRCSQYHHTNVPYVLPKSCLLFGCIGRLGEGGSLSSNRNFYFGESPFSFFLGDRPIKMNDSLKEKRKKTFGGTPSNWFKDE